MTREQTTVPLRWPGTETLKAARAAIRGGSPVEIELPLEVHYALYAHLHAQRKQGAAENIDASGGAELLAPIATVAGLEELGHLQTAVRRAHFADAVTAFADEREHVIAHQPVLSRRARVRTHRRQRAPGGHHDRRRSRDHGSR